MAPFGFMVDGLDEASEVDADGDRWFQADEYGDRSYMWEYRECSFSAHSTFARRQLTF